MRGRSEGTPTSPRRCLHPSGPMRTAVQLSGICVKDSQVESKEGQNPAVSSILAIAV